MVTMWWPHACASLLLLHGFLLVNPAVAQTVTGPTGPTVSDGTATADSTAVVPVTTVDQSTALTPLGNIGACPAMPSLVQGSFVELRKYSVTKKMDIKAPGNDTDPLATITASPYAANLVVELKSITGSLMAKLVNPAVFWDTTADLYDCHDKKLGELQWSTANILGNVFNPYQSQFELFDANGTQVGNMVKTESGGKCTVDLASNGQNLIQMDMELADFGESLGGLFGAYTKATITLVNGVTPLPSLLMDARILSLVAAAQLAGTGPTLLFWFIDLILICCCLCCCCGCSKGRNPTTTVYPGGQRPRTDAEARRMYGDMQEKAPLVTMENELPLYHQQPKTQGLAGFLSCCTRKGPTQPPPGAMRPGPPPGGYRPRGY